MNEVNEMAANAVGNGGVDMAQNSKGTKTTYHRKQFKVSEKTYKSMCEGHYDGDAWTDHLNLEESDELSLYLFSRNNPGVDVDIVHEGCTKKIKRKK